MSEFTDPRNGVSYPFSLLTEGDTQKTWHSPDTDFVVIENTNLFISNDGAEEINIPRKGWYTTQISNICFRYLEERNVPTHFLWPNTEVDLSHTFAARPLDKLPVKAVVRNLPYGSYLQRHPDEDYTMPFPEPLVEFFENNSEFGNPLLVVDHERETVSRYRRDQPPSAESRMGDEQPFREMGHLMLDQWEKATEVALSAALALRKAWELGNAMLAGVTFELGVDEEGKVRIGGTLGPDSWHLWRDNNPEDPLDRELFRDRHHPGEILNAHGTILLEAMQWLPPGGGGNTGNYRPGGDGGGGGSTGNSS